jgi:hypothetical protein
VKTIGVVSTVSLGLAIVIGIGASLAVADDSARVSVTLKDHKFSPSEPTAPAGKPIVIEVSNLDSTPSEFESKTLRVEKVVLAGNTVVRAARWGQAAIVSSTTTTRTRQRVS